MNRGEPDEHTFWQKIKDETPCCLHPFFDRRVQSRVLAGENLEDDPDFDKLLTFWGDDPDALCTVQNERQHTDFNRILQSKQKNAKSQSAAYDKCFLEWCRFRC